MVRAAPQPWEEAYRRQGRLWRGSRLDPLTRRFLDARPSAAAGRWLDAGCGDGKGLAPLSGRVAPGHVVGADRSIWGLRLARDHAPVAAQRLVRGDARAWPFAAGAFEVVRAVHLVGHLVAGERPGAMAELARLVAPGGHLLVGEFGAGDFRNGQGEMVEPGTFRRGHGLLTHYFTREELVGLVEGAGLDVVAVDAERYEVRYGGVDRPRERWELVGRRG